VESRAQIAAIVGNRIGKTAARLFAEPSVLRPDGTVEWVDAGGEPLKSINSLPEEQGQAVLDNYVILKAQIEALASQMEGEGDAGRLAASIIRLALVTPEGFEALHVVGQQPVLVNWGYAVPGQLLPGDARPSDTDFVSPWASSSTESVMAAGGVTATSAADPGRAETVNPPPAPAEQSAQPESKAPDPQQTEPDQSSALPPRPARGSEEKFRSTAAAYMADQRHRRRVGPIAWLIPLLLLLALGYVIWLLLQPLDPVIVEEELPPGEAIDPVPDAQARRDALRAQLDEAARLREGLDGICVALPKPDPEPEPALIAPEPDKPEPPQVVLKDPVPEPDKRILVPKPDRVDLPPEVPEAEDIPVDLAQQTTPSRPEPTLCEPGWTPTQRPEVMVVIDGSGSMSESFPGATSRIDAARRATEEVVRKLHKDIRAGLVSFTDCNATSTPKKYRYNERGELISRVRDVSPSRGTSLANSIRRAGNAAKSGGPATVVVVSDGEDTCGGDPCAAARKLKARKPLLKVNVIDLSGGRSAVLQCVASVTGGRVFTPRSASQMNEEMQQATGQPDASQCNQ
jgi:hypothetical protein